MLNLALNCRQRFLKMFLRNFSFILLMSLCTSCFQISSYYPEGPTLFNGRLFFVEYSTGKVKFITKGLRPKSKTFWKSKDCGPAGLIAKDDGLWVSCYDKNSLVLIKKSKLVEEVFFDPEFIGPNDFASIDKNAMAVSFSGVFDKDAPVNGKVAIIKAGKIMGSISKLHYPNGLAFDSTQNRLYVSEHFQNRVLVFQLKNNYQFEMISAINLPSPNKDPYLGPDGLKFDSKLNMLYIAQYAGGRIYSYDLIDQRFEKTYSLTFPYPTNVLRYNNRLIITAIKDANTSPYQGEVFSLSL
jgi:sugar lactone lactonase YvrE